jgi:hypothetical protein
MEAQCLLKVVTIKMMYLLFTNTNSSKLQHTKQKKLKHNKMNRLKGAHRNYSILEKMTQFQAKATMRCKALWSAHDLHGVAGIDACTRGWCCSDSE